VQYTDDRRNGPENQFLNSFNASVRMLVWMEKDFGRWIERKAKLKNIKPTFSFKEREMRIKIERPLRFAKRPGREIRETGFSQTALLRFDPWV